jgi:hypothetical protein
MKIRRSILIGLLSLAGLLIFAGLSAVKSAGAAPKHSIVLFSYKTTVIDFNLQNGVGTDIGHMDGVIHGDLLQNFQFIPQTQTPPITVATPNDRALFTDVDGNQILFKYAGTGTFFQGLSDNTPSLVPPPPPVIPSVNLGNLQAVGGYFLVDYTVLQASPKYAFLIGRVFPAKIVATNSAYPSNGAFGSAYGEIYATQSDIQHIKHMLGLSGDDD